MDTWITDRRWHGIARALLLVLLAADLCHSFVQYLHQPLDGDMAWNAVPSPDVKHVLADPLGAGAILHDRTYPNPNRFFCHWPIRAYLLNAPLLLQRFTPPIDSVYLACALAKILVHVALIYLLAVFASGTTDPRRPGLLLAATLITPLFQANGYRSYMGVIDPSTTYTFFYALPAVFLLAFLLPLAMQAMRGAHPTGKPDLQWWWTIPAAFVVCLSGPLNPGAVLVLAVTLALFFWTRRDRSTGNPLIAAISAVPSMVWPFIVPAALLSLYSLFLGRYNSITIETQVPLSAMYAQLPQGLLQLFTVKLGPALLLISILANLFIISKWANDGKGSAIITTARWFGLFALLYIALLPLGGYRDYRPYIVRYDTILPVTLGAFVLFATSALHLLNALRHAARLRFGVFVGVILLIFAAADTLDTEQDACEREALHLIARSTAPVVALPQPCSVLDWRTIPAPEGSLLNAELLRTWRITDTVKPYYNQ